MYDQQTNCNVACFLHDQIDQSHRDLHHVCVYAYCDNTELVFTGSIILNWEDRKMDSTWVDQNVLGQIIPHLKV